MKLTLLLFVLTLNISAQDPRTFFQVSSNIYSATNGWNLVEAKSERGVLGEVDEMDSEGNSTSRFVIPHTPMMFQLKNSQHEMVLFNFSTSLAGEWTNKIYKIHTFKFYPNSGFIIIPSRQHRQIQIQNGALTNFYVREAIWNPTNGLLTSAAVDFQNGKVRFNSDVP